MTGRCSSDDSPSLGTRRVVARVMARRVGSPSAVCPSSGAKGRRECNEGFPALQSATRLRHFGCDIVGGEAAVTAKQQVRGDLPPSVPPTAESRAILARRVLPWFAMHETRKVRLGIWGGAVAVSIVVGWSGCGGGSRQGSLPACGWPASLGPGDGSAYGCTAARMLLICNTPGGGGADCISNDPTTCFPPGATSGAGSSSGGGSSDAAPVDGGGSGCVNQCSPGEYAVACFPPPALGPAAGMAPLPPSACRLVLGRDLLYCCPCGGGT